MAKNSGGTRSSSSSSPAAISLSSNKLNGGGSEYKQSMKLATSGKFQVAWDKGYDLLLETPLGSVGAYGRNGSEIVEVLSADGKGVKMAVLTDKKISSGQVNIQKAARGMLKDYLKGLNKK